MKSLRIWTWVICMEFNFILLKELAIELINELNVNQLNVNNWYEIMDVSINSLKAKCYWKLNKLNESQFNMIQLELNVLNQIDCKFNKFGCVG